MAEGDEDVGYGELPALAPGGALRFLEFLDGRISMARRNCAGARGRGSPMAVTFKEEALSYEEARQVFLELLGVPDPRGDWPDEVGFGPAGPEA